MLLLLAALIAVGLLSFFSIDLGPAVRERAEREGTNYLKRPMHIGKLTAMLWPGRFELHDVVIEGVSKTDEPFLFAKKIAVSVTWRTLISKEIYVDVDMSDWTMAIEKWEGRPSSIPKLTPDNPGTGPKRFSTTVRVTASRGKFSYRDHETPWNVVAPNLNFNLVRSEALQAYVGTAHFEDGVVQIQNYLPMATALTTRFTLDTTDGARVQLHHIDLVTDGARSSIDGELFLGDRWPEQRYRVDSRLSFSRMRELFFANEAWRVNGDGRFRGTFAVAKGGRYDLRGQFSSDHAMLDTPDTRLSFPRLLGALEWVPGHFAVTDASADFYGGRANFSYLLSPLGTPRPANARFVADYAGVDLEALFRGIEWQRMDLRGRATGHNEMMWRNGSLKATLNGTGRMAVTAPPGTPLATVALSPDAPVPAIVPFQKDRPLGALPVSGDMTYRFDPDGLSLDPSWVASPSTYLSFRGRADYSAPSNLPFHVTSHDWQESDRILAAILTAAGSPTSPIEVGGRGQFDGVMTQSFSRPRIEGAFNGQALRSWGVTWGRAIGDIVIENQFVTIKQATIDRPGGPRIVADGRFALGFRRPEERDEELTDVHVQVTRWPLLDFREAFGLVDWPITGSVDAADIRLSGPYKGPFGTGTLRLGRGTAWGEAFDSVQGDLAFSGAGLDVTKIVMAKDVAQINGSAVMKWDGTYAFDARGDKVPVESLTSMTVPNFPLSGVLQFTASGEGEFASPKYSFKFSVPDLSAGSQGIGAVSGALEVRGRTLTLQQIEAHSMLLQGSGTGVIALNDAYDATLNFKFLNSRLDPYLPLVAPKLAAQLSQYTRAVVGGSVQIQGELKNLAALGIYANVDTVELALSPTYTLTNDGIVRLAFENDIGTVRNLRLVGPDTNLSIEGDIPRSAAPMQLTATGNADLAILKLLSSEVESSGAATLNASFRGSMEQLNISGQADITNGRLRHRSFPHGLEQINGPIQFDADRITVNALRARMAEGDVTFSGAVELNGLIPAQFNLRAEGRSMGMRYPAGFKSTINASLTLTGPVATPTLSGDITVLRSILLREIENDQAILALMAVGATGSGSAAAAPVLDESTSPIRLDLRIRAPSPSLRIETTSVNISGSANLTVRGTMDAPVVTGRVDLERGTGVFSGNRWTFQPSSIEFINQTRMQPYFDVAFSTRILVPTQAYDVTVRIVGQTERLDVQVNSNPYLPTPEIVSLLLGERPRDGSIRTLERQSAALAAQNASQTGIRDLGLQLLALPVSSRIGSVVQRTTPCDTFSLLPTLGNEATLLTPGARFTCGKRLSERVYLTYSHALSANNQYDVVLLEYEQSDRVSWVLSRNEDRTFALDFRIRHVF